MLNIHYITPHNKIYTTTSYGRQCMVTKEPCECWQHHFLIKFSVLNYSLKKSGATAEYSPQYHTAARLEFKSCSRMLVQVLLTDVRVRLVVRVRAVLQ